MVFRWRQITSSRIVAGLLVGGDRAGDRVDRRRRDVVAALDQADELVDHRRRLGDIGVVAVEGEHVAAQEHVAAEPLLELAQDRVLRAGELGGDRVVEGELAAGH